MMACALIVMLVLQHFKVTNVCFKFQASNTAYQKGDFVLFDLFDEDTGNMRRMQGTIFRADVDSCIVQFVEKGHRIRESVAVADLQLVM